MTTYNEFEESVEDGQSWEAFDIYTDLGEHWRHTTAPNAHVVDYQTYEPAVVDRDKIELEDNNEAKGVKIKLWREHPLAQRLVDGPIEGVTRIVVYRGYEGQSDDPITYRELLLRNISWDKDGVPTLHCEPDTSTAVRGGHRRVHQRICDHALYGTGFGQCNLAEADWQVDGVFDTVNGLTLTSSTFALKTDGWYARGKIIIGYSRRMITYHVGNTIKVDRIVPDLTAGSAFTASAGCNHTPTMCLDKFDNKLNYGGNEFAPSENVFQVGMGY
jgi:hypothetical protein